MNSKPRTPTLDEWDRMTWAARDRVAYAWRTSRQRMEEHIRRTDRMTKAQRRRQAIARIQHNPELLLRTCKACGFQRYITGDCHTCTVLATRTATP